MADYQKGKIYKLISIHTDKIYIGSTIQTLVQRKQGHKRDFKNKNKSKKSTSEELFELGINDVEIVLVELFPCNTKEELFKRERYHIENTECVNLQIPCRTRKEYRQDNKDVLYQKHKEWVKNNSEKIKKYRETNKKKYVKKTLLSEEEKLQRKKDSQIKHYEKVKEERQEEIGCRNCKCMITKGSLNRHLKSKKHLNKLKSNII